MENRTINRKKNVSSRKNTKKTLIQTSTKYKILAAGIITCTVLLCGGYFAHQTGLPAKLLTGATVAGESVKVNELNYHYIEVYNMYTQYGIITSKEDLTKVYDEATGQTYGDYLYEVAAKNQQNIVLLNNEAEKAGYKSVSAQIQVDEYIDTLRTYASSNKTTADSVLQSQYGRGLTVRDLKTFMKRELVAQEYADYLKQTQFNLTQDKMKAMYDAAPADYDTITFNSYYVAAAYDSTATDAQKAEAVTAAAASAQAILAASTDPQSFRDASEADAGTDGAASFADGADPTVYADTSKADITNYYSADMADYLYADSRAAGDKTVITTDAGAYAVYFQSRQLNTAASVSYRSMLLTDVDIAAVKAKAEGYQSSVTDEASFIDLVKKYSDDSSTAISGGLKSSVTAASIATDAPTESEAALSAWLFAADRKAGDMTIIENVDGVTLYYFQKSLPSWESVLFESNVSTEYTNWYTALAAVEGNGYTLNMGAVEFATY